jgi:hypothetical protein
MTARILHERTDERSTRRSVRSPLLQASEASIIGWARQDEGEQQHDDTVGHEHE